MDPLIFIGLAATLVIIVGLSIWSGTKNKPGNAKNSMPVVTGAIIGTLVGGSSTVGTAQLAYNYGMSAWWFTLGAGIACLVLAFVFVVPLRRSGTSTLVGMIRLEFGSTAGMAASILSSIGTFIAVISQLISATAVIAVLAPTMKLSTSVFLSALFMVLYVIFGGTKGAGMVGIVKTLLLYIATISSGCMVLSMSGGLSPFTDMVRSIADSSGVNFFSLFARGAGKDIGACLSLILGVLTTQTYAQAVLSGKTDKDARCAAITAAVLAPPIGIGGILVGLYMRANAALYPGLTAKTALTTFVTTHMPPLLAGIVLGGLFVACLGTGSGLSLGIASIINNELVKRFTRKFDDPVKANALSRVWIVVVLALASALSCGSLGDVILQFSFMSMGLRGAVVFVPLLFALWKPGTVDKKYALVSIIAGPLVVLIFGLLNILPFDPLFLGILISFVSMVFGYLIRGSSPANSAKEG